MSGKRRLKLRIVAMEDQAQGELNQLVSMANGLAEWVRRAMVMQAELGKAIERVGQQQCELRELAEKCEQGY